MSKLRWMGMVALAWVPTLLLAHTHLQSSMPADNSVLAAAPKQVMLMFGDAARLTALTIQKSGDKEAQKLEPLPKSAGKHLMVDLPQLTKGDYVVNWRAVGDDGHVMNGTFKFKLTGQN